MAAQFAARGLVGERVVRSPGEIAGQGFILEDLDHCEVVLMDRLDSLMADDLSHCRVFVGPTRGSAFLRGCTDCAFTVAARQIRLVNLRRCTVFALSSTQIAFEDSEDVTLCPYNGDAAELPQLLAAAGIDADPAANKWSDVHDFSAQPQARPAALLRGGGGPLLGEDGLTPLAREHLRCVLWRFDVDRDGALCAAEVDAMQVALGEDPVGQAGVLEFAAFGDGIVDIQGRLTFHGLCTIYALQEESVLRKDLASLGQDAAALPVWAPMSLTSSPPPVSSPARSPARSPRRARSRSPRRTSDQVPVGMPVAMPTPPPAAVGFPVGGSHGGGFPAPDHAADAGGFPAPDHAADAGGFPAPDHAADAHDQGFPAPDHAADAAHNQADQGQLTTAQQAVKAYASSTAQSQRWTVPRPICQLMDAARARGVDTVKWFQSGDKGRDGHMPRAAFEQRLRGLALALDAADAVAPEHLSALAVGLDDEGDGRSNYRLFLRRARIPTLRTGLTSRPPSPGRRRAQTAEVALAEAGERIRKVFRKADRHHRLRQRLGFVDSAASVGGAAEPAEGDVRVSLLIAALHEAGVRLSPPQLRALCRALDSDGNTVSREALRLHLLQLWNSRLGHQSKAARQLQQSEGDGDEDADPQLQTYDEWLKAKAGERKRVVAEERLQFQKALSGEEHSLSREQIRTMFERFEPLPDSFVEFESTRAAEAHVASAKGRAEIERQGNGTAARREEFDRAKRARASRLRRDPEASVELFQQYHQLCRVRQFKHSLGSFHDWLRHLQTADDEVRARREELEAKRRERRQREEAAAAEAAAKAAAERRRPSGEDRDRALSEWERKKRKEARAARAAARKAREEEKQKEAAAAKKSKAAYRKWKRAADRGRYISQREGGRKTPRPSLRRAWHQEAWVDVAVPGDADSAVPGDSDLGSDLL